MQNARLDEAQTGIKIVRKDINNLRYADDTTLKAESVREEIVVENAFGGKPGSQGSKVILLSHT